MASWGWLTAKMDLARKHGFSQSRNYLECCVTVASATFEDTRICLSLGLAGLGRHCASSVPHTGATCAYTSPRVLFFTTSFYQDYVPLNGQDGLAWDDGGLSLEPLWIRELSIAAIETVCRQRLQIASDESCSVSFQPKAPSTSCIGSNLGNSHG